MEKEYCPAEIAEALYDLSSDMDMADYAENRQDTIGELTEALYQVSAIAQNNMNADYWRTLYKCLENVCYMTIK